MKTRSLKNLNSKRLNAKTPKPEPQIGFFTDEEVLSKTIPSWMTNRRRKKL